MLSRWLLGCVACVVAAFALEPLEIQPAIHILGFADVRRNSTGVLRIDAQYLNYRTETASGQIPIASLKEFTIERETKGLVHGNAGKLVLLAPFGSGRALSMIRSGVDTVTLQYSDPSGGLHGCILMLPKNAGESVARQLKDKGVPEGAAPETEGAAPKRPAVVKKHILVAPAVQVAEVTGGLPAEFSIAIYEQLIEGLWKSGQFLHVYRAGDRDAETKPDRLVVKLTVEGFKKGNERARNLAPFAGATVIDARLQVSDLQSTVFVDKVVSGAVRSYGENLDAADSLVRKVVKTIRPK